MAQPDVARISKFQDRALRTVVRTPQLRNEVIASPSCEDCIARHDGSFGPLPTYTHKTFAAHPR